MLMTERRPGREEGRVMVRALGALSCFGAWSWNYMELNKGSHVECLQQRRACSTARRSVHVVQTNCSSGFRLVNNNMFWRAWPRLVFHRKYWCIGAIAKITEIHHTNVGRKGSSRKCGIKIDSVAYKTPRREIAYSSKCPMKNARSRILSKRKTIRLKTYAQPR